MSAHNNKYPLTIKGEYAELYVRLLKPRSGLSDLIFGSKARQIIITIQQGYQLPNIFLDAHTEGLVGTNRQTLYDPNQRLSLEGDLDESFQLYAPKGQENEALVLLDPAMLVVLRDQLGQYDITMTGSNIYLDIYDAYDGAQLDVALQTLAEKLDSFYRIESRRDRTFDKYLTALHDTQPIKLGKRNFSTNKIAFAMAFFCLPVFITLFYIYLAFFNDQSVQIDRGDWMRVGAIWMIALVLYLLVKLPFIGERVGLGDPNSRRGQRKR